MTRLKLYVIIAVAVIASASTVSLYFVLPKEPTSTTPVTISLPSSPPMMFLVHANISHSGNAVAHGMFISYSHPGGHVDGVGAFGGISTMLNESFEAVVVKSGSVVSFTLSSGQLRDFPPSLDRFFRTSIIK